MNKPFNIHDWQDKQKRSLFEQEELYMEALGMVLFDNTKSPLMTILRRRSSKIDGQLQITLMKNFPTSLMIIRNN